MHAQPLKWPVFIGGGLVIALGLYALLLNVPFQPLGFPVWVLAAGLVLGGAVPIGVLAIRLSRDGRQGVWRTVRQSGAAIALAMVGLFVGFVLFFSTIGYQGGGFCDGSAPVWVHSEGGCYALPRPWDYLWPPDHWFAPSRCLGLCQDLEGV